VTLEIEVEEDDGGVVIRATGPALRQLIATMLLAMTNGKAAQAHETDTGEHRIVIERLDGTSD
jgi:hypothetical protein